MTSGGTLVEKSCSTKILRRHFHLFEFGLSKSVEFVLVAHDPHSMTTIPCPLPCPKIWALQVGESLYFLATFSKTQNGKDLERFLWLIYSKWFFPIIIFPQTGQSPSLAPRGWAQKNPPTSVAKTGFIQCFKFYLWLGGAVVTHLYHIGASSVLHKGDVSPQVSVQPLEDHPMLRLLERWPTLQGRTAIVFI